MELSFLGSLTRITMATNFFIGWIAWSFYGTAREWLASKMRIFRFIDKELWDISSQLRAYCRFLRRITTC